MTSTTIDTVQASIDRYWTDRADNYGDFQDERFGHDVVHDTWARIWAEALPPPPATILDVGTGTGHVARLLAELGHEVTGIDRADGMLRRARATVADMADPPAIQHGDAVAPDAEPLSLDAITSRYLLWTLRQSQRALTNWRRLLRPGGTIAIVDTTWFPDGLPSRTADAGETADGRPDFARLYDERVARALPLAEATTIRDTVALVTAAGYHDVAFKPLHDIFELDHRLGVAPGHEERLQFMITAVAP